MFMYQSTFQPWSLIPADRARSKYFILLSKDPFLRDGEQGRILENSVLLVTRKFSS